MLIKAMFGLIALIMIHSANAQTGTVIRVDTIEDGISKLEEIRRTGGAGSTQSQIFNIEVIPNHQQWQEVLDVTSSGAQSEILDSGGIPTGMMSVDTLKDLITINVPSFCLNLTIGCE